MVELIVTRTSFYDKMCKMRISGRSFKDCYELIDCTSCMRDNINVDGIELKSDSTITGVVLHGPEEAMTLAIMKYQLQIVTTKS